MVIWKVRHEYEDNDNYPGYVDYWGTKREALEACRVRDIPIRDAEITKLTLKSKSAVINALVDALMTDNSYGGV